MLETTEGSAEKPTGLTSTVYQVSVPRGDAVRVHGLTIPPSMGVATVINFQPTSGNRAVVTGDFVMSAAEVDPVVEALTRSGIGYQFAS